MSIGRIHFVFIRRLVLLVLRLSSALLAQLLGYLLHDFELFRVAQIARWRIVAEYLLANVNVRAVNEPLLHVFEQLWTNRLERVQLVCLNQSKQIINLASREVNQIRTFTFHVVHKDLGLQNAAQLGQRFNVNHLDDYGTQPVVQNAAQFLQKPP